MRLQAQQVGRLPIWQQSHLVKFDSKMNAQQENHYLTFDSRMNAQNPDQSQAAKRPGDILEFHSFSW